jgi:hypothetical protein
MCEAMDKGFKQSYWLKALKLVPKAFRQESPRPKKKSGKLRQNLHSTCFGGKNQSVWTQKKTIQLKDSICFNSVQIGS